MKKPLDISIVIAFHNHAKMTIDCVRSIYAFGPKVREILLISNNSSRQDLAAVEKYAKTTENARVLVWDHPFNYQKEYNWGIAKAKGSFVLMMNNDIELRQNSVGLIERMYGKASQEGVGIVGCTLLYGNEKNIQHAGIYLMPEGLADHMYVREKYSTAVKNAGFD